MFGKKKEIEKKCKNCQLYDRQAGLCRVVVLHEGERIQIPVDPTDECFFTTEFTATETVVREDGVQVENVESFSLEDEIKQVNFWVEDKDTGERTTGDGIVKIEYPEGFFGEDDEELTDEKIAEAEDKLRALRQTKAWSELFESKTEQEATDCEGSAEESSS